MQVRLSRRDLIASTGIGLGAMALKAANSTAAPAKAGRAVPSEPFGYCFNMATIMGKNLPIEKEIEIAAQAGYRAIEPWLRRIDEFVKRGGSLADLKKRIADLGLSVEGAIGFANWVEEDETKRTAGMEQMRRDMETVAKIGGKRIAAPPAGGTKVQLDLPKVTERYRKVCELGHQLGVTPALELWGASQTLHRLGEVAYVLAEAAHPRACAVLDVYHIYKGGSDFAGLGVFDGQVLPVFHMNDYPADPPREKINDAQRVYPGDGVAPLDQILRTLHRIGFCGMLSLELFNRSYWEQDALEVAKTGLAKMKAAVAKALSAA